MAKVLPQITVTESNKSSARRRFEIRLFIKNKLLLYRQAALSGDIYEMLPD
jgi:hypothetical protein